MSNTKRIDFFLPEPMFRNLKTISAREDVPVSSLLRRSLKRLISERLKQKANQSGDLQGAGPYTWQPEDVPDRAEGPSDLVAGPDDGAESS